MYIRPWHGKLTLSSVKVSLRYVWAIGVNEGLFFGLYRVYRVIRARDLLRQGRPLSYDRWPEFYSWGTLSGRANGSGERAPYELALAMEAPYRAFGTQTYPCGM